MLIATWLTLFVVVSRLISTPLRRLAAATSKVSQGDFTPLPHPRRDEIGRVVASFNAMVLDLEWKNREVAKLIAALRESEKRYREHFDGAAKASSSPKLRVAGCAMPMPPSAGCLGYREATPDIAVDR